MISVEFIPISEIVILQTRFRRVFTEKNLCDLQDSISSGLGLSNAITIRADKILITGGSRLKAIKTLHKKGIPALYQGVEIPKGTIPAIVLKKDYSELKYLTAELHENVKRENFTYLEEAQAVTKIALLEQALLDKEKTPTEDEPEFSIADITPTAIKKTAKQLYDGKSGGYYDKQIKDSVTLTYAMEKNAPLRQQLTQATSLSEGQKILKTHEKQAKKFPLIIPAKASPSKNSIIHGDCLEKLKTLTAKSFDVCLTYPLQGLTPETLTTFERVMPLAIKQVSRLLKDEAHLYLACDIRNYSALTKMVASASLPYNPWKIAKAPFIQYKVTGGRIPHPGFTPRRSYELWLYAYRGDKQEYKIINDVIPCLSDSVYIHKQESRKPKELLKALLTRSCIPDDNVLDFMAGSGSIITACQELKLSYTAIEIDKGHYEECLGRVRV